MAAYLEHWDTHITVLSLLSAAVFEAIDEGLKTSPNIAAKAPSFVHTEWWHLLPLIFLVIAGAVWAIGKAKKPKILPETGAIAPQTNQAPGGIVPGIPTLSSLLGQNPAVNFDAKQFFALAYYSPITAEIEKNIKIAAAQNSPSDKEAFYARFIGLGLVAYQHDVTWFTIYGSQLEALSELNSKGVVPLPVVKEHYDAAVPKYPAMYPKYTFDQWLKYMLARTLIVTYPSNMVEITHNGRDLLKYLAHVGGRNVHAKDF